MNRSLAIAWFVVLPAQAADRVVHLDSGVIEGAPRSYARSYRTGHSPRDSAES